MPVEAAVNRIETANRTCSIFVGVGSAREDYFDVVEYSYQEVNVYNDTDFPAYPPYHDLMDGVVFVDKHTQPSHDTCLNDLLQMYYGDIDPLVTLRNITAVFQTGDMVRTVRTCGYRIAVPHERVFAMNVGPTPRMQHVAIYDFARHTMTVSNAGVYNNVTKTAVPAYNRMFVELNMTEAFNTPAPSV